jgi:hypothetical protein
MTAMSDFIDKFVEDSIERREAREQSKDSAEEVAMTEMFPGEDYILSRLNEDGWEDSYFFTKALSAGNAMISISLEEGYARWQMHQKWNRAMHAARASKIGIEMVVGFFRAGEAEELSLFEAHRFWQPYDIRLVIGRGCPDMAVDLWADWDTSVDQQFDEDFSMGGEEWYHADTRTYKRESGSGRHHYVLRIEANNRVSIVEEAA